MPMVKVTWLEGRTAEQKKQIALAITDAMTEIGNAFRDRVDVVFEDISMNQWSTGGVFASNSSSGWTASGKIDREN
tara:strand:+ start:298 stop:525 length:228 start_codon:yes stop_codon:yes gene_type:complete